MLGNPSLRLGDTKDCRNIPPGIGWGGKNIGRLVTWEFPLRTASTSWKSLKSFIQFNSFCSSCTMPDNSKKVFWSSMSFRLASVSKVELWNFRNSISVRLCWWTSRKSNFCRHNCPCRSRRSSSAWAAWSSWWPTFSRYSAVVVCLCSSSRVLICAFELFRSSSFPDRSTTLSVWMSLENLLWALYVFLVTPDFLEWSTILSASSCPDPSNITDDDDWLTDKPPGTQSSVCRCEHLAESHLIHVLVRGRDHEGEGDWWVVELDESQEVGLITCVRSEGVQGVLTLIWGGVAQTSHDDRVVELKEQLGIEEKDGEGQEGPKRKKGEIESKRTRHGWHGDDNVIAQNLSHEVCGVIIKCGTVRSMCRLNARCAPRNRRSQRRHWCTWCALWTACCACRSSCCLWWCCGSSHTCSSSFHRSLCFRRIHFRRNLLYWRYSVYRCCCVGFGSHLSPLVDNRRRSVLRCHENLEDFFNPVHHVLVGSHQFPNLQTRDSDMMDLELGISTIQSTAHCPSRRQQSLNLFCTPSLLWFRLPEDWYCSIQMGVINQPRKEA